MTNKQQTQEQVITWAREAGATRDDPERLPYLWTMDTEGFIKFFALAYEAGRKDENEAIAVFIQSVDPNDDMVVKVANAIRARREQ